MADTYTQCLLRRDQTTQRVFIPTKYATLGEVLKLRWAFAGSPDWVDGWKVVEVGQATTMPEVDGQGCYARRSGVCS